MIRSIRAAGLAAAGASLMFGFAASAATAVGVDQVPPSLPLVQPEVVPADLSTDEKPAHMTWNLRAALNVAALQCQFSPFYASVANYNELLKHHSSELAASYKALGSHFKRTAGKRAQKDFDVYTTRTYNSYSSLLAQVQFCKAAANVAREALAIPKGGLAKLAAQRVPELRASLVPQPDPLTLVNLDYVQVPAIINPCLDRKGRIRTKC